MEPQILRKAGPNEKRCIIRHSLGFYGNLIVGGIYSIPQHLAPGNRLYQPDLYALALVECVQQHPILSATTKGADTNDPVYTRPPTIDLQNHVRFLQAEPFAPEREAREDHVTQTLQQTLEEIHNKVSPTFNAAEYQPAWLLDIVPISKSDKPGYHQLFISFTYSHSHGDGMSGLVFHRTFQAAFSRALENGHDLKNMVIASPTEPMSDQPDVASKLPISISYLLRPALGTYLPGFLARWLGVSGIVSGADEHTWTFAKTFTDDEGARRQVKTNVEVIAIEPQLLNRLLSLCKKKNIKLTAFLDAVIAQSMHEALTSSGIEVPSETNFISVIPVNLRKPLGYHEATIGNYGGAAYLRYEANDKAFSIHEQSWDVLRSHSEHLGRVASSSRDQPIGLLRFISHFPSWMQGQIGKTRDCSWELSNLGRFDPHSSDLGDSNELQVSIDHMLFSQSASSVGPPLVFNTATVKNGGLNISITWQPGALALQEVDLKREFHVSERERDFVQDLATCMRKGLAKLTSLA